MKKVRLRLRKEIEKYKKKHNLNTSTLREHKIHGVGHDTIRKIMTVEDYMPSKRIIKDLFDGFGVKYTESYEGIKIAKG